MKGLVALLLALSGCVKARETLDSLGNRELQIIGGIETTPHEFPSIVNPGGHSCTGTLIHRRWVLIAAHCLEQWQFDQVVAGDHNIHLSEGNEVRVNVTRAFIHPSYESPNTFSNDIALLELYEEIELNEFVQLATLPPRDFDPTGDSVVVGWGITELDVVSDVLRKATVPLLNSTACELIYPGYYYDNMICARTVDLDNCFGDMGGPLFCSDGNGNQVQCGIVSSFTLCGLSGSPSIYARTSHFIDWIEETIGESLL